MASANPQKTTYDSCTHNGRTTSEDWVDVLAEHRPWLGKVVYSRLQDWDAVQEVLQETALAASKNGLGQLHGNAVCRWLYRVAVRQTLLRRRRNVRQKHTIIRFIEHTTIGTAVEDNPYELLAASEQRDLVRQALRQIRPRDCQILLLKYCQGWTCREMAQRLGTSESTIKSRLLRARQHLRQQLLRINRHWELP